MTAQGPPRSPTASAKKGAQKNDSFELQHLKERASRLVEVILLLASMAAWNPAALNTLERIFDTTYPLEADYAAARQKQVVWQEMERSGKRW